MPSRKEYGKDVLMLASANGRNVGRNLFTCKQKVGRYFVPKSELGLTRRTRHSMMQLDSPLGGTVCSLKNSIRHQEIPTVPPFRCKS